VWPEGPKLNAYACRVETERGPRTALFYIEGGMFNRRRVACLIEQGSPEPLASIPMPPAQYADIVPDHRKLPKVRD
jgi:hypothetical protein